MSRAVREEVENARMKGILPPERDKNGQLVNPHIPAFMSAVPIWMKSDGPTLSHQRLEKAPEKSTEYEKKRDPYANYDPRQYRQVIRRYEQMEKERERVLKEAKDAGKTIEPAAVESKQGATIGGEESSIQAELQRYSEAVKMNVRNLRKREDTAKYLFNLSTAPEFFYDGKARSMRGNPFPNAKAGDHEYEGDLMYDGTGEAPQLVGAQAFAFEAQQHGVDTHVFATPTALSLMMTDHEKKKIKAKEARQKAIQEAYGTSGAGAAAGEGGLIAPAAGNNAAPGALQVPRSLLLGQSGAYVEYDAQGKPVIGGGDGNGDGKSGAGARAGAGTRAGQANGKGEGASGPVRSKWGEDKGEFGHRAAWGSWCCSVTKRWGYACCYCGERGAPCAGLAGRAAWRLWVRRREGGVPREQEGALEGARQRRLARDAAQGGIGRRREGRGRGKQEQEDTGATSMIGAEAGGAGTRLKVPALGEAQYAGHGRTPADMAFDGDDNDGVGSGSRRRGTGGGAGGANGGDSSGEEGRGPSLAEEVRAARARGVVVPEVGSFREAARKEAKDVWGTKGGKGGDADRGLDGGGTLGEKRGGAVLGNAAIDLGGGRTGQALLDSIKDSDDKFRTMGGAARAGAGLDRAAIERALAQQRNQQAAAMGPPAVPGVTSARAVGAKSRRDWHGDGDGGDGSDGGADGEGEGRHAGGASSSEEEEDDGTSGAARRLAAKRRRKAIRDAVRLGVDPEVAARQVDGSSEGGSGDGKTNMQREVEMLVQKRPDDPMA